MPNQPTLQWVQKGLPALLAGFLCFGVALAAQAEDYLSSEDFLNQVFDNAPPETKTFWVTGERKTLTAKILQHPPSKLRQRYWQKGQRSVWIMDEIGKEKPITVGIVVNDQQIEQVKVLSFRESRGWEVRYPFFVKQYKGLSLTGPITGDNGLSKSIDNITGATLSVRAVNKVTRLALIYHTLANAKNVTQPPR